MKSGTARKPLQKYEQVHYASKLAAMGKAFKKYKFVSDSLAIMRGKISQNSKKFSYVSNGKQSSFISVIALLSSKMTSSENWTPRDVDDIVNTGDMNFRKRVKEFPPNHLILPVDLRFQMYLDLAKIQTRIGALSYDGVYSTDNQELADLLKNFLDSCNKAVVNFNTKNFAIWLENKAYYLFNSEDTNETGSPADKFKGAACIARSKNIRVLTEYMTSFLKPKANPYTICSFEAEPFEDIEVIKEPSPLADLLKKSSSLLSDFVPTLETIPECPELEAIVEKTSSMDFSDHYEFISVNQGFLKGKEYLKPKEITKAAYLACSSIAMLRIAKSHLWVRKTLTEIFKIGTEMFTASSKKVQNARKPITDRKLLFNFGKHSFQVSSDNVVFGHLRSTKPGIVTLEEGLKFFFKTFDCGIIQGPDTVAVWQEKEIFYLMDHYQCEQQKRGIKTKGEWNSCLNWFRNIEDLAKHYMANIPKNIRKDIFEICTVEVDDLIKKSNDWCNFKPLTACKWILSGTISQNDDQFLSSDRNMQGTACSVVSIAYSKIWGVQSWDSKAIDEIIKNGNKLHRSSTYRLKESAKFVNNNLRVSELQSFISLRKTFVDLHYDEACVNGVLNAVKINKKKNENSGGETYSLEQGLTFFFEHDEMAVLTSCGISIAVFKQNDGYFLFDSHDRDESGRQSTKKLPGTSCVVRFTNISEMTKHILSNFVNPTKTTEPYNLSKVEPKVRTEEALKLFDYQQIKDCNFGAILYPLDRFHEDHQDYKITLHHKTICNLVLCLGFTEIFDARKWNSSDLNEIFKLGMKQLKEIAEEIVEDEDEILELLARFVVGSVHLSVDLVKMEKGNFTNFLEKPEDNDEKPFKSPSILGDFEPENKMDDKTEVQESANRASMQSIISSVLDITEGLSLAQMLKPWERESEVSAILISELFKLAIWKKSHTYFVFDSKEADEDGKLVNWRLKEFIHNRKKSDKNNRELRLRRRSTGGQNQVDHEHIEETEGKIKHFLRPSLSPSMPNISVGNLHSKDFEPKNVGSSYVAWFSSVDLLVQHILAKFPEEYQPEPITLKYLTLKKSSGALPLICTKWNRFNFVEGRCWLLRASISQNNTQFSDASRNNQDVANCVIALCFSHLCQTPQWKTLILDVILKYGDRLYTASMANLRKIETVVDEPKINLDQLDLPVQIKNIVFTMNYELFRKTNWVETDKVTVLNKFFESSSNVGLIMLDNYYVAIWKAEEDYFMFDPHENGPDGMPRNNGVACLHRFTEISALVKEFEGKSLVRASDGKTQGLEFQDFSLYRISIVKTILEETHESTGKDLAEQISILSDYDPSKLKKLEDEIFAQDLVDSCLPKDDAALLPGDGDHNTSEVEVKVHKPLSVIYGKLSKISKRFCPVVKEKHACAISLVAAGMACTLNPSSWTDEVIDTVVVGGNSVYLDSCAVNKKKDLKITEIIEKLHVGAQEVELAVVPISTAIFNHKSLKNSLISLQETFQMAYLAYNTNYFTLLFDGGFFLFDPLGLKIPLKKNPALLIRRASLYTFEDLDSMIKEIGKILEDNKFDGFMRLGGILKTDVKEYIPNTPKTTKRAQPMTVMKKRDITKTAKPRTPWNSKVLRPEKYDKKLFMQDL